MPEARDHTGVEGFTAASADLPAVAWLQPWRTGGAEALAAHGFPGARDEDWKYTRARPVLKAGFGVARGAGDAAVPSLPDGPRAVFVDGRFRADLSVAAEGAVLTALGPAHEADASVSELLGSVVGAEATGFEALNNALLADGAFVRIAGHVEGTLHVVHHHTGGERVAALRTVIVVERSGEGTVVEHFTGAGAGLTNAVTEVRLADNASLTHIRLQDEAAEGNHIGTVAVRQARDATYRGFTVALGARLSRTDVRCILEGPGASADLQGLALLAGEQHTDFHTHVDHVAPHTTSRELFKTILDGRSRGVFTGRVVVRPDAQKIDSVQSNHNLLLSDRAVANTRPQLEIRADDVKCAHGATVGKLDVDASFYLRQRGLDPQQVRAMLTSAFANEVVRHVPDPSVRTMLEERVWAFLGDSVVEVGGQP